MNGGKPVNVEIKNGKLIRLEKMKKPFWPLAETIFGYDEVSDIVIANEVMPNLSLFAINFWSRNGWRQPLRQEVLLGLHKTIYPGKDVRARQFAR